MNRIKRIGNSKEPTIQRMLNIANNLREEFGGFCSIDSHVHSYTDGSSKISFWMSVEAINIATFIDTWPEVIAKYRELRREKSNALQ